MASRLSRFRGGRGAEGKWWRGGEGSGGAGFSCLSCRRIRFLWVKPLESRKQLLFFPPSYCFIQRAELIEEKKWFFLPRKQTSSNHQTSVNYIIYRVKGSKNKNKKMNGKTCRFCLG
jgi:hypothetical protein